VTSPPALHQAMSADGSPEGMHGADRAMLAALDAAIRIIPDFPQPGIQFRDITPMIAKPALLRGAVDLLAARAAALSPDVIVAVEARGFLFGGPLALALGIGLVPVRKPGKLPALVHGADYGLEYGRDRLEIHSDAIAPGARVLLLDDLLATGGTVGAAASLVRQIGGDPVGALFLIELAALGGRARLAAEGIGCDTLLTY
jgi:adenine phosphoribosyltransferase